MRFSTAVLLCVLALPALAAPTPFERIAVAAKARWSHEVLRLSYQPEGCAIRAVMRDVELRIPLREVTWTLGTDGVVTGTCAKGRDCISGLAESHTTDVPHASWKEHIETSRFAFRFEGRATELVADLRSFAVRWCRP